MLDTNAVFTGENWKLRFGAFLLLVGVFSLAQAASLFQLGSSDYSTALILLALGSAFSLDEFIYKHSLLKWAQIALAALAIFLIIVF